MIKIPEKLEFGNTEHIQLARKAGMEMFAETFLTENKKDLILFHWKGHSFWCDSCGSDVQHCGDKDPEIEIVEVLEESVKVKMFCTEGMGCDETVEVEVTFRDGVRI